MNGNSVAHRQGIYIYAARAPQKHLLGERLDRQFKIGGDERWVDW